MAFGHFAYPTRQFVSVRFLCGRQRTLTLTQQQDGLQLANDSTVMERRTHFSDSFLAATSEIEECGLDVVPPQFPHGYSLRKKSF